MSGAVAGTGTLIRLILRRDRAVLATWIPIVAVLPAAIAASTVRLYPEAAEREAFAAGSMSSPAQLVTRGVIYDPGVGGLTAWTLGSSLAIIGGLISILLMVRHTRAEEEDGRRELLASGVVGRHAPLLAALTVVLGANLLAGLLTVPGLVGSGLPIGSSVLFGLSAAAGGWVFAAVAAVTAQLSAGAGTARGLAIGGMAALFAVRSIADAGRVEWLSWLSPFGWVRLTRPYAGDHWQVLGLLVAFTAGVSVLAFALSVRRDVGGGLIPERVSDPRRPGPQGPFGLAWRLQRGTLTGFTIGFALFGALLGLAAHGLDAQLDTPQFRAFAAAMGGPGARISDVFFTFVLYVLSQLVAASALVPALRARREETTGRAEALLATPLGRTRWGAGHLVLALAVPVVVLAALGAAAGLTYGDPLRVLAATLAYVPAVWVLVGIATALFGLLPRAAVAASWTALGLFLLIDLLAEFHLMTGPILDLSPFVHIPAVLLDATPPLTPLLALSLLAAALCALGLLTLDRRDLDH